MMKIYVCKICGYSYDPAKGDSYSNIDPGTDFEKLPPEWHCPVCLSAKEKFECAG